MPPGRNLLRGEEAALDGPTVRPVIAVAGRPERGALGALVLIVALSLGLNAAKLRLFPNTIGSGETVHWWPIALNLAHGQGYSACFPEYFPFCGPANQATAAREPVPILLFALVARLTHDSLVAAALAQVAINLGIVVGVYALARQLAGTGAGLAAALIWALYLPVIQLFVPQISGDLLAAFWITWGLVLFLRAGALDRPGTWLAAGACFGVAALSRTTLVVALPALIAGMVFWSTWHEAARAAAGPRLLLRAGYLVVSFILVLAPWVVRNLVVLGQPIFGSTLTGYNLYRHNHILAGDDYLHSVGPSEAAQAIEELLARRPDLTGAENEAQMDAVYRAEALRIIAAHPLRYAALVVYRLPMLWFDWGVDAAYGQRDTWADLVTKVQQGLLLCGAALGLRTAGRRARPLALLVVALGLACLLVTSRLRLLLPAMPAVVALGGIGCAALAARLARGVPGLPALSPARGGVEAGPTQT